MNTKTLLAACITCAAALASAQPVPPTAPAQAPGGAGSNPFARPTAAQPAPTAQPGNGAPAAGMPPAPQQVIPPGFQQASPSPMQGMPGMPPMPVTEEVEEVSATRIGTVNGVHVYRGQNTYVFESSKTKKVSRKAVPPSVAQNAAQAAAQAGQAAGIPPSPALPSMVGRTAPR